MMSSRCSKNEKEAEEIKEVVTEVTKIFGMFDIADVIGFGRRFDFQGIKKRARNTHRKYDALLEKFITERKRLRNKRKLEESEDDERKDLLDLLLDNMESETTECFKWKAMDLNGEITLSAVDMTERPGLTTPRIHDMMCLLEPRVDLAHGRILDEEVDTPTVASENPDPTDQAPISGATGGGAAVAAAATVGAAPAATAAVGAAVAGGAGTAVAGAEDDHTFSFFMHDILGGSNPSAIAVTGIVTNPAVSGQVPFAKPNGAVLAVDNGVPTNNSNSGIISNNNIPFLTALSGTTSNLIVKQSNIHVINTE
ncbi:hypothetical protein K7X08_004367 [Anisodus acutangulus]|uniref:Uncharacterized protein n=1 Tax=Anisodus acutangulus TaxID=402998 RepID=A0A9Q1RK28_9SOLA|nr:hypothetical protein K7X08_004367 [Anisodus acutangulus]